jgi:fructose 1,6-bisphosphatase
LSLLETAWHRQEKPVRLIGLGVQLRDDENPDQADLFIEPSADDASS